MEVGLRREDGETGGTGMSGGWFDYGRGRNRLDRNEWRLVLVGKRETQVGQKFVEVGVCWEEGETGGTGMSGGWCE